MVNVGKHYAFIQHSIDLNARDTNGCTALHLACSAGNRDIVHRVQRTSGMTPLYYACKSGIVGIVSLLMIASIDLNARETTDGQHCIMHVLKAGNELWLSS